MQFHEIFVTHHYKNKLNYFFYSESAKGDVKKEAPKEEEAMEVDEHKPADTKSPTKEAATVST